MVTSNMMIAFKTHIPSDGAALSPLHVRLPSVVSFPDTLSQIVKICKTVSGNETMPGVS